MAKVGNMNEFLPVAVVENCSIFNDQYTFMGKYAYYSKQN